MTQRRFGPIRAAGVAIVEKDGDKTISPAPLGVVGYVGILEKGRIDELIEIFNKNDFLAQCGSYIDESLVPDSVFDFFNLGNGAGRVYLSRITDGTELNSSVTVKNRRSPQSDVIKFEADNGGRWGGKKSTIVKTYTAVTQTTLSTGITMLEDEYKDANVILAAVLNKSYKVISNDTAGILTFDSDVTLQDDIGASVDQLYSAILANEEKSVSILIKDGLKNPTTEWSLEVYVDDVLVSSYDDLSSDPVSDKYFVNVINADTANFYIKVTDLNIGSITADIRPANYHNQSSIVTTTKLTANIFNVVTNSVASAIGAITSPSYGSTIVKDVITLECTAAGTRADEELTSTDNYANDEEIVINGRTITFKGTVTDTLNEVLVGATEEDSIDNLVTFINGDIDVLIENIVFAEKDSEHILHLWAANANDSSNSITTTTDGVNATWGGVTLSGGVDQTWDAVSSLQGALTVSVVTGDAYTEENSYSMGFILTDKTFDSTKMFAIADTVTIEIEPFLVDELSGHLLMPNTDDRRSTFVIESNTSFEITVRTGSDLTAIANAGDSFIVIHTQELGGGYDGVAGITDQDYLDALDTSTSLFNQFFGKNVGLVKTGSPGVTATAVQKAGATYAESRNYQWRYEIPSNIVTDSAAEQHVNDVLGRNDFAVVTFPSFAWVTHPLNEGMKLVSTTGMIHGREALVAKNYNGYHKAGSDISVTLPNVLKLTTGDRVLNEEFLNPHGIGVIKRMKGNFVIWGDRTVSLDPAWKWKHQREYMSHQENILRENFDWIIFAINSTRSTAQAQLITSLKSYFLTEFIKGALEGANFDDAVIIKVDNENNTAITRANGDLNAEIKFRIVDTVERLIITMSQLGINEVIV